MTQRAHFVGFMGFGMEAPPYESQPLPQSTSGEEEPTALPRQGGCRRAAATGAALAAGMLMVGTVLLFAAAAVHYGRSHLRMFLRDGPEAENLRHRIAAVEVALKVPIAEERIMEQPVFSAPWSQSDQSAAHMVEWGLRLQDVRDEGEPKVTQKFLLLKHVDGKVTLKDQQNDFHVDALEDRISMVGSILVNGELAPRQIEDSAKFELLYNFDSTISLRHFNGYCITGDDAGNLRLDDCDANDGAGSSFSPVISASEGAVTFKSVHGRYLTVVERWVQDYKTMVVLVDKDTEQNVAGCSKFIKVAQPDGTVSFKTSHASYLAIVDGKLSANSVVAGPAAYFNETRNMDGTVSMKPISGSTYLQEQSGGALAATAESTDLVDSAFAMVESPDGTVSLKMGSKLLCAAERTITVLTCETRKASAAETWPMQGVSTTLMIKNVCFGRKWYGFKTKVDAYKEAVEELAVQGQAGQIVILVDNSDMAFGGCSYEELIFRYDRILNVTGASIVAGADNSVWPREDWPYSTLEDGRKRTMQAFGMRRDKYCDHTSCPKFEYKYANSGFLMGPPEDMQTILGCMLEKGQGHYGATGYDDQAGLQRCMFGDYKNMVALDYSGTLSMQLIRFNEFVLYEGGGKVYNRAAGGMSQCFVHGNGDTFSEWWPRLFPGSEKTEDYGKNFAIRL